MSSPPGLSAESDEAAPAPAPTPSALIAARGTPLNQTHIRMGYAAFNAGNYEEAMMYFQLTEADPLQILSLFPDVLPSGLAATAGGGSGGSDGAPAFPPSSPFSRLRLPPHPVPVHKVQGEERLFRALSALIPYLAQIQNRLRLQLQPIFAPQHVHKQKSSHARGSRGRGRGAGRRRGGRGDEDEDEYEDGRSDNDDEEDELDAIPTKGRGKLSPHSSSHSPHADPAPAPSISPADSHLALAILIDTALLKAYLLCDIPLLPFLTPDNLCDVDECANILRAYEKWTELLAFYKYRARHEQALELLAQLGQMGEQKGSGGAGAGADGVVSSASSSGGSSSGSSSALAGLSGTEATIRYLQELAINIHQPCFPMLSATNAATNAGGMGDTHVSDAGGFANASTSSPGKPLHASSSSVAFSAATSSPLSPAPAPDTLIALVLHYSKWPLLVSVDDGLRIFTYCHTMNLRPVEGGSNRSGSGAGAGGGGAGGLGAPPLVHSYAHHASHCIPAHLVLEHLKKCADREACIAYLESLITHVGETNALFHNELIFLYLDSIQKLMQAQEQREKTLKTMRAANQSAAEDKNAAAAGADEPDTLDRISDVPVRSRGGKKASTPDSTLSASTAARLASGSAGLSTRDSHRLRILRRKLLDFLRSSVSYTAEKMLSRFPRGELLDERAILLSRINQHVQALNIYAHKLHDPLQAEAYAEEYWTRATREMQRQQAGGYGINVPGAGGAAGGGPNSPNGASSSSSLVGATLSSGAPFSAGHIAEGRDMYLKLLQVYLKPPPLEPTERASSVLAGARGGADAAASSAPSSSAASVSSSVPAAPAPMLDAALRLLHKYYDRMPPMAALESLPPETPLQALWPYLEKLMCHTCHTHRHEQITKHLLKAEYYAMKERYLASSRGRVLCDSSSTCAKCHKKLGLSAFARYPNGSIVHYNCHQQTMQQVPKGDL